MNTPWTDDLCRQAYEAMNATKVRTALGFLTTVLSVYPEHEKALEMAATILYFWTARSRNASAEEPLTLSDVLDTRLDRLFCSCDSPGCGKSWISIGVLYAHAGILHAQGGRCRACGMYTCRTHYGTQGICGQCGGVIDVAPPANGRTPRQTVRLNQPVVHMVLLREGPLPPSREFVQTVLEIQAPDVLEDRATISVFNDPTSVLSL